MLNNADFVGKLLGIMLLIAFVPYVLAILRGKTKPNRSTWLICTIVAFLLGFIYYSEVSHTLWVPVSYIMGPLIVVILSFKYGEDEYP